MVGFASIGRQSTEQETDRRDSTGNAGATDVFSVKDGVDTDDEYPSL